MKYQVTVDGKVYEVEVQKAGAAYNSLSSENFDNGVLNVQAPTAPVAPKAAPVQAAPAAPKAAPAPAAAPAAPASTGGEQVISPMPGNILKLNVADGAQVSAGDVILILEAMKMENEIPAPCDGTVSFKVKAGDTVDTDQVLAEVK